MIGDTNKSQQNQSPTNYSNQNSPVYVHNKTIITDPTIIMSPNHNGHSPLMNVKNQSNQGKTEETIIAIVTSPTSMHKKPVQKVTPSRNMNAMTTYKNSNTSPTTSTNGNASGMSLSSSTECDAGYVKPKSPTHMAGSYYSNTMPASTQSMSKIAVSNKAGTQKPNRYSHALRISMKLLYLFQFFLLLLEVCHGIEIYQQKN